MASQLLKPRNYLIFKRAYEARMLHDMETHMLQDMEMRMLQDMDAAITKSNMWHWLKTYDPPPAKGFMFDNHPNIKLISSNLQYDGHSGGSFAWTMRNMQYIAKHGWGDYRKSIHKTPQPVQAKPKVIDLE